MYVDTDNKTEYFICIVTILRIVRQKSQTSSHIIGYLYFKLRIMTNQHNYNDSCDCVDLIQLQRQLYRGVKLPFIVRISLLQIEKVGKVRTMEILSIEWKLSSNFEDKTFIPFHNFPAFLISPTLPISPTFPIFSIFLTFPISPYLP